MDYVNEKEAYEIIAKNVKEKTKRQQELDVFFESFEGNQKLATNTQKEESTVSYWNDTLKKKKADYMNSVSHFEKFIDVAKNKKEIAKRKIEDEFQRAKAKYESELEKIEVDYKKTELYVKNQQESLEASYTIDCESITTKLERARNNLTMKIDKRKPKKQLELEKAIEECNKQIKYQQDRINEARRLGTLIYPND